MERILIGAEKSYGEKAILSAVAIFALPIYENMQHAPYGSPIGRVLRFAFCRGVGIMQKTKCTGFPKRNEARSENKTLHKKYHKP